MTQRDLAEHLGGITQAHISYLEGQHSAPSLALIVRVANLFGVTTDYLLRDALPIEHPALPIAPPQKIHSLAHQFGVKLRLLRKQRGMTQVDVAHLLGDLSQVAVSAFERGEKAPSIAIVLQCAAVFGVTTDELLRNITQSKDTIS